MIDVTKDNFLQEAEDFVDHLTNACYIAIDEEMTGISVPAHDGRRVFLPKGETPEERYARIKGAPERYSIIQLGVTLFFDESEGGNKVANGKNGHDIKDAQLSTMGLRSRVYNFHVFSTKREIRCDPDTIKFLTKHGLDYNMWLKKGINCATKRDAQESWRQFEKRHTPRPFSSVDGRKKVEVTRPEDVSFLARVMAGLREWLDSPGSNSYSLPPCNSFRRRALYERIESEYPSLVLEKGENSVIHVLRLSPEEKRSRDEEKRSADERNVRLCEVGLHKIFEALSNANKGLLARNVEPACEMESYDEVKKRLTRLRNIPIVVHNGLMDLLFLMTHFNDKSLPDTWFEAKSLIHNYFPVVYDTKYILSERPCGQFEKTTLSEVYLELHPGKYASDAHNAGFDSFMTGAIFLELNLKIIEHGIGPIENRESCHKVFSEFLKADVVDTENGIFGRNKLYFMRTLYNIDLESELDPMIKDMKPEHTYRISQINPGTRHSDVLRQLDGHEFEIIWLDDISFLLVDTTRERDPNQTSHLLNEVFPTCVVTRYNEWKTKKEPNTEILERNKYTHVLSDVLSIIGFGSRNKKRKIGE